MNTLYVEIRKSKAKGYFYDIQGEKPCVVKGTVEQVKRYARLHSFKVFLI